MSYVLSGNTIPILSIITAAGLMLYWIGVFHHRFGTGKSAGRILCL